MSITCFSSNENTYLNHNNNHEQTNSNSNNSNLIASSTTSTNQFRQKLLNNNQSTTDLNSSINHNLLNNNIIQNSKSDHMISCFDTFQPVSRTTTPISYLTTNSSLDGYFALNTSSNQHALNSQLINNNLNRCHSSNSNCSTNSKLNNSSLISSRPASSLDNFLILSNDSDDSTQANNQQLAQQSTTNQTSVLSYYPHIIRNENNINFNNNSNSNNSTILQQSNSTATIHHSANFHQQSSNQVKEEFLDQQTNYHQNSINFQATNDVQVLSNLNSSLNTSNNHTNQLNNRIQQDDLQLSNSNLDQFSNSSSSSNSNNKSMNSGKKRRNKLNGGPPARPQCVECGKDFSNQSALSKHKLTHSEERKFVCHICQKGFKRQDHLTGHLFTHRDKKPYQCDVKNCEKTYCDARSLKRHKENHHHSILNHLTLGKNLTVDLLNAAVKASSDGRIQYAPALNENSNELDLNSTILDSNSIDRSQLLQLINQVDGDSAAAISLLQQLNEQETNSAKCPICSKKFKNVPALNGHMRLHGGFYRSNQQQTNNENSNQRSSTVQQSTSNQTINTKNELHQSNNRNDGPIDLIKKDSLFVDRTNQNNQQQEQQTIQSNNQQRDVNSNIVKDKIRKHIANTPVIIENPNNNSESTRFQQQQLLNNNRVQYFAQNETSQNNLLTTSVINTNPYLPNSNKSPLTTDHQQLQLDNNHSPPINNEIIQQQQRNEQDLLNNNQQQDKQQVVHDSSWFDDQNNVLHLKEQLQQQLEFRTPNSSTIQTKIMNQTQHPKQTNNQNLINNRIPAIPAHVFSNGEKFRRHSDSTAEILNQQNISHHTNYLHHQQQSNLLNQDQIHPQAMNSNLNQEQLQPINYEITNNLNNQIENNNNNNLINFEYPKRKLINHRLDNETSTNETMETIPESQLINSTSSVQNYLSTTTTATNHLQQTNQFYSNSNNCNNNQLAAYQSHSVPTTPTINQNFFNNNQRIDLNGVNQQLNHSNSNYNNSINSNQISHHSNQHLTVNNQQHSLPCTPKQSTSFTFSPHQVQHYQQQNQQQSNYHNNHQFNSSPNTPHTPITPVTPTSNCNQYQDNLIMGRSSNLQHPQTIQSNQMNTINNKNLYPATIEYGNNTICSSRGGKFNETQNINSYDNMINNQYLETNDNLNNSDHLNSNNNNYSSATTTNLINDNYLVNNSNTFNNNNQTQFNNCQQLNNNSNYQINNIICSNDNSNTYSSHQQPVIMNNYATNDTSSFTCDTNQSNQNNNLINDELIKNNSNSTIINNDNKIVNCQPQQSPTNITPEKQQFKRGTLDSSSPTLFIATDSYKNSTADDSQTFPNINEEDNEDDDVFLAPASPPAIKSNFNFNNKKNKPFNLSSSTFLANNSNNLNHHIRSSNLPQCVDFTQPQQPKLSTTAINLNSSNNNKLKDEELNDINFNSIKAINNNNYNNSNNLNKTSKDNKPRNNSPKRTKHRPEPLYIPPHVNARHKTTRPLFASTLGLDGFKSINQPPPYTPPPMLSPVRTNSSYYWHILTGNLTPKTITNFFSNRTNVNKNLDQQSTAIINNQNNTTITNNLNNSNNNNKKISFEFFNNNQNDISTPLTTYEPLDSSIPDIESTFDFSSYSSQNAHVNIGKSYQARIPTFNPNKEDAKLHYKNEKADKLWSPTILDNLSISELSKNDKQLNNDKQFNILNSKRKTDLLKELDLYFDLSCSACVKGNGRNIEYAYHILFQNNGDLTKSIKQLLEPEIKPDNPLYNYKYNETDLWTDEEIKLYYDALLKYDKDFLTISKQLKNKNVKQCIEFYYLWKKIRTEEYRKHRLLRRRKEQDGINYCINVK